MGHAVNMPNLAHLSTRLQSPLLRMKVTPQRIEKCHAEPREAGGVFVFGVGSIEVFEIVSMGPER